MFVARLFSYDWVYFGAGIVDVGRKLQKRLKYSKHLDNFSLNTTR